MPVVPMNADGRTTSEQLYIPTLLVVGGPESLALRCHRAARTAGLAIRRCALEEAAVAVPRRHPIAIVVPNDVFDMASQELSALARDVRSELLPVDPEVSVRELEAMIAGAVDGSLSQRERRGGAGRYSIVDGLQEEAPFSQRGPRSSSAPPVYSPQPVSRDTRPSTPQESAPASLRARQTLPRPQLALEAPRSASGTQRTSSAPLPPSRSVFSSR